MRTKVQTYITPENIEYIRERMKKERRRSESEMIDIIVTEAREAEKKSK